MTVVKMTMVKFTVISMTVVKILVVKMTVVKILVVKMTVVKMTVVNFHHFAPTGTPKVENKVVKSKNMQMFFTQN